MAVFCTTYYALYCQNGAIGLEYDVNYSNQGVEYINSRGWQGMVLACPG